MCFAEQEVRVCHQDKVFTMLGKAVSFVQSQWKYNGCFLLTSLQASFY